MNYKDRGLDIMREQLLAGTADCHELQLRPNYRCQLVLPRDLTQAEAKRLIEFISWLAMPATQRASAKARSVLSGP